MSRKTTINEETTIHFVLDLGAGDGENDGAGGKGEVAKERPPVSVL
jgi:hypothetical protein